MKGMELPINMIVVVLIAVLVLTTVGIFLTRNIGSGTGSIDYQAAWGKACTLLRFNYGCDVSRVGEINVQSDPNAPTVTFTQACQNAIGSGLTVEACARQCGCNVVG